MKPILLVIYGVLNYLYELSPFLTINTRNIIINSVFFFVLFFTFDSNYKFLLINSNSNSNSDNNNDFNNNIYCNFCNFTCQIPDLQMRNLSVLFVTFKKNARTSVYKFFIRTFT